MNRTQLHCTACFQSTLPLHFPHSPLRSKRTKNHSSIRQLTRHRPRRQQFPVFLNFCVALKEWLFFYENIFHEKVSGLHASLFVSFRCSFQLTIHLISLGSCRALEGLAESKGWHQLPCVLSLRRRTCWTWTAAPRSLAIWDTQIKFAMNST